MSAPVIHYVLTDGGDGTAYLKLFKDEEAAKLYDQLSGYELISRGHHVITQQMIDSALDVEGVRKEFE